jgi:hypothetical protein
MDHVENTPFTTVTLSLHAYSLLWECVYWAVTQKQSLLLSHHLATSLYFTILSHDCMNGIWLGNCICWTLNLLFLQILTQFPRMCCHFVICYVICHFRLRQWRLSCSFAGSCILHCCGLIRKHCPTAPWLFMLVCGCLGLVVVHIYGSWGLVLDVT